MRGVVAIAVVGLGCGRVQFDAPSDAPTDTRDDAPSPDGSNCDVTAGLAGHWTFDVDQITATQVLDSSGADQHGTLVGPAPAVIAGRLGDALDFAATSTYIEMPGVSLDGAAGAFNSVSMWFFQTDAMANQVLAYLPQGPTTGPPRYDLWMNFGGAGATTLCINGGSGDCWGISDPGLIGRWVHVVAVFVNGAENGGLLYLDGALAPTTCRFGDCTTARSAIGPFRVSGSDSQFLWHGLIDDVRVYNRALSAAEVQTLHACAP